MKVVFLADVPNVAKAGEIKEVANGYGRNYLLPHKLAAPATPDQLQRLEGLRKALLRQEAKAREAAEELALHLAEVTVRIKARAGAEDRLYGSITSTDIAEELTR